MYNVDYKFDNHCAYLDQFDWTCLHFRDSLSNRRESWVGVHHAATKLTFFVAVTLHDIVHTEKSLTLVFEYLERDLKQYMDDCGGILAMNNVKVR